MFCRISYNISISGVKLLFGRLSSKDPEILGEGRRADGRASQLAYTRCIDRGALAGPKQVCGQT